MKKSSQWSKIAGEIAGEIYRADYTDILKCDKDGNTKMENILQNTSSDDIILIGDLNCNVKAAKPSKETQKLMTLCEDYQLQQLIDKPTRITTTCASTIDHIWTRNKNLVTQVGTCEGLSDHCGIYALIENNLGKSEPEEISFRDFKNFNETKYKEDIIRFITGSDFQFHLENKDVNKAFNTWVTCIQQAGDENTPIIKIKQMEKKKNHGTTKNLQK